MEGSGTALLLLSLDSRIVTEPPAPMESVSQTMEDAVRLLFVPILVLAHMTFSKDIGLTRIHYDIAINSPTGVLPSLIDQRTQGYSQDCAVLR